MSNDKKKFLFDLNNFDTPNEPEPIIEEEIEIEPPPPMFSEDEMDATRAVAHSNGMAQGRNEEKLSREERVAETLNKIAEEFSSLYAAETYREKQYEEESLKLCLEILKQTAPTLQNLLGMEALKGVLKEELLKQGNQSEIKIEVSAECVTEIDAFINTIWRDKDSAPNYKVLPNDDLQIGACKIEWADGGMIRNPEQTAASIKDKLEKLIKSKTVPDTALQLEKTAQNDVSSDDKDENEQDAV